MEKKKENREKKQLFNKIIPWIVAEASFSEVSQLMENSLGEESDGEDRTEQERDAVIDASGDTTTNLATESDDGEPSLLHSVLC